MALRGLVADARLLDLLETPVRRARVHSVFRSVVNLDLDGTLVTLAARTLDPGPMTAVLDAGRLGGGGVRPGEACRIDHGRISVAGLAADVGTAVPWTCVLPAWDGAACSSERLAAAVRTAGRRMVQDPGSPSAPGARRLTERAQGLGAALQEGDAAQVASAATALIGLGDGLTPTGDDVLTGVLVALAMPGPGVPAVRADLRSAVLEASGRTGDISRAMLVAAADGRARQRIVDLLRAVRSGNADDISAGVAAVLRIGHSSGADICSGIVLGLGTREAATDARTRP